MSTRSRSFAASLWMALGLAVASSLLLSPAAVAGWPPQETSTGPAVNYADPSNWPNDPGYAGDWQKWSFVPQKWQNNVTDQNKKLGTGSHVDQAWAKTTGDRRILISVVDSGADWGNGDLANKWFLNAGELPAPTDCPGADGKKHDVNGDGIFNVQDYTTVKGHALATFATVCDKRLLARGDYNKNGILDPQDLLQAFSNGIDEDNNGYIDDISGWDFFRNDNDPFDDTIYGHGNGEANWSAAEGNNAMGNIGTCPDCSVQLLRGGDSFYGDTNAYAMALFYAVDSGSSVIQHAFATANNSAAAQKALDYAYAQNVFVVTTGSDLDSFHQQPASGDNHTFTVHAITHDSENEDAATTFLAYNNCSNYGAQQFGSVPGGACASEATGQFSGMVGLLYAAALQANIPAPPTGHNGDPNNVRRLSAYEVHQLVVNAIDDLYDPADAMDPLKYPTRVGWDMRFGYGRVNARKQVDQVLGGRIPPEVDVLTPNWFEVIHPERTPMVPITGHVSFRNAAGNKFGDSCDYVVEYAPGIEPDDASWKEIAHGTLNGNGGMAAQNGTLAMWDVSQLTVDNPSQGPPDNLVNRYMVTLRVRATIHAMDPTHEGVKGEFRKAVFVQKDPDLVAGFPIRLGCTGESSPKLFDLDGDHKREIILADACGAVHAFRADGSELPGWPVHSKPLFTVDPASPKGHSKEAAFTQGPTPVSADIHAAFMATVAIGDVDGDGKADVFAADVNGNLYVFHADGTTARGWPKEVDRAVVVERGTRHWYAGVDDGVWASPVLADFDGDGVNEIVVADLLGEVTVWKGDGTKLPGYPARAWDTSFADDPKADEPRQLNRIVSSPAVGDLNGDKVPDIVVGTNENYQNTGRLYALDGKTGLPLPGWPISVTSNYILPSVGSGIPSSPSMADINGDGIPEITVTGIGGGVIIYDHNGKVFGRIMPNERSHYGAKAATAEPVTLGFAEIAAFGDLDDNGGLDMVLPTVGQGALLGLASGGRRRDFQMCISAWDVKSATYKVGFPRAIEDYPTYYNAIIADIDGDGHSETVVGSAGYFLHAFHSDGSEPKGWPKFTGGWVWASPTVGDIDGDGKMELVEPVRSGWLYAWHTGGPENGRVDWPSFHHDLRNTGNYGTALDIGGARGMPAKKMPNGCACSLSSSTTGGVGGGALLLGLVAAARILRSSRRRRRG